MYKVSIFTILLVSVAVLGARSLDPPLNDDVLGLIVFKSDLRDPDQKLASWNEDDDTPCAWNGVKCHPRTNRVTELTLDGFSLSGRIGRGLLQLQSLHKLSLSNNNLTGTVNANLISSLGSLKVVDLSGNGLTGSLPDGFFRQCGSLRVFSVARNRLTGKIPVSVGSCSSLASLNMSSNGFSGSIPLGVWGLNTLRSLDLSRNELEGEFGGKIGRLNNLRALDLSRNKLSGPIPREIGSCMLLKSVDLSENSLSGNLPDTFQQLSLCYYLNLGKNLLRGEVPKWIGEMRSLETLDLSMNNLSGVVPSSIGNLISLKVLNFSGNGFSGSLPESTGNCINLVALDVSGNSLTGKLPVWMFEDGSSALKNDSIKKIQVLDLSSNSFSGVVGAGLGDLRELQGLNLSRNSLTGPILSTIGDLKHLSVLDLSHNQLNGIVPRETGGAVSLQELRLENNMLEGTIPSSIKNCSSLQSLILSHNKLVGAIPPEMARLANLQEVDLSFNELTGTLPKQLANLGYLHTFNISHNHLSGELPAGGFFNGISPDSVSGNQGICGAVVKKSCPAVSPKPIVLNPNATFGPDSGEATPLGAVGHKRILLSISSLIAISAAAAIVVGVIAITVLNLRVRATTVSRSAVPITFSGGDDFSRSPTTDSNSGKLVMFSGEPDFSTGTHALLNKDCELGRGGFGAVYRTVIRDEYPVAIKKLTVSSLVKSQEEFEREVKKLGKLRHTNLVKLEGYYWTTSLQLLIYEFLSGGSLYKHLHEAPGGSSSLSWNDRFNVILGTAKCLAYLHQSNIIHYNIKSSNVLLDSSGEPKVGDYGLARLLPMLDRYVLSSKIQSALGYMAPEFACRTVKITEKCDVYGFGVLVLEVVTGKKPVEYMEDDVVVLCDMVREALEDGRAEECIDLRLQGKFPVEEAVAVIKLGLICTSQVPSSRPHMGEAVNILRMIRCPSGSSDELGSS
ncbi:Leucine-rich repeat protein kinase family protein [Raphanus sativus]|uniref:Probable LRR receptor-like serine/threonine-protein kinase IRK n=1 Tax=Raphanus sativus TaxID=3726 RepID=A0A6J0P7F3_RAPSA|nr:probable LRR receptor-like serine/threonine-protein kinase IRK [Raphanus sativus]KAJ4895992.1 Leucine-rich repeat protein kinase family protein [Raphanus sativus]